jgi:ubiquinone biosynthesis protein UbiJ
MIPEGLRNNLLSAINWAISRDDALHAALRGLAGRRLRVLLPADAALEWVIEADGLLRELGVRAAGRSASMVAAGSPASDPESLPDVTVRVVADLASPVRIEGDALVAERLAPLIALIKSRLSPWEQFWNASPAGMAARQFADYARYEAGLVIGREDLARHAEQIRHLMAALDRLEKRVDAFRA